MTLFKLYMSGKTSSKCWRATCNKTASFKNAYKFIYSVHNMLFFTMNISPKKLSLIYPDKEYARKIRVASKNMVLYTLSLLCISVFIPWITFFKKIYFAPNTEKMGQNWTKNRACLNLLKNLLFNFYWICCIIDIYMIFCVSVHNLSLVKKLPLKSGPKSSLPITLQNF